jgi:hypothetical protein
MSPRATVNDFPNGRRLNPVAAGQHKMRDAFGSRVTYFAHLSLVQLCLMVPGSFSSCLRAGVRAVSTAGRHQSVLCRVSHVFGGREVFQILQTVIQGVAVYVVHLFAGGAGAEEGGADELVEVRELPPLAFGKFDLSSVSPVSLAPGEAAAQDVTGFGVAPADHAPHPAHTAYFVDVFPARDGSPDFGRAKIGVGHAVFAPIENSVARLVRGLTTSFEPFCILAEK